ncbi:MAG: DsbA family protein [Pseudomonadota bacterium]
MTSSIDRRAALGLMSLPLLTLTPLRAMAQDRDPRTGDFVLGNEDAAVTVIEYASLTCPHCAGFHIQTWPEFKKNYVDTGKVRFIMREVYFDYAGLYASMVSRCAGSQGFYPLVDQYLKQQDQWSRAPQNQIEGEIRKIGRINGLSDAAMDQCLTDQDFAQTLVSDYQNNVAADAVEATPTFIINGNKYSGNMTYPEFSALVDQKIEEAGS